MMRTQKKFSRGTRSGRAPSPEKVSAIAGKKKGAASSWSLRLYVAGRSPKSQTAVSNLRRLCEQHIPGRYDIEVVDLLVDPGLAKVDQILAIPTLVRRMPPPLKRFIGDLSDTERAMVALELTSLGQ
jgi:circadian clock protein KaiB